MTSQSVFPQTSFRAGRYISQQAGYKAFIPVKLPPEPPIQVSGELQAMLSKADRALGRLDGSIQTLPNPDLFVYMYVRKEAVLSSQIEGTQSSLQDVLAAEAKIFSPDQPKDVNEVVNYVRAMNHGLKRLAELPVSIRLIREIHAELMKGVRGSHLTPGELRTSQNWIGSAGCTLNEAVFVPPPPHELSQQMADLESFLHSETDLPLLIQVGLAHAQFETVHPFLDGNGRVGRLLITFLLCEKAVLSKPVLYLSYYFKKNRQQYNAELQSIRDSGTWEKWLEFFLRGVAEVSNQAAETARKILSLRELHRQTIAEKLGRAAGKGHLILEYLYQHPIVSVNEIKVLTKISYTAANNLITRMVNCGILSEQTGYSRNRRFIYRDYYNLFAE